MNDEPRKISTRRPADVPALNRSKFNFEQGQPSAFEHKYVNVEVIEDAIFAIGESFARDQADKAVVHLDLCSRPKIVLIEEKRVAIKASFSSAANTASRAVSPRAGILLAEGRHMCAGTNFR
jgi:hypothetical protein